MPTKDPRLRISTLCELIAVGQPTAPSSAGIGCITDSLLKKLHRLVGQGSLGRKRPPVAMRGREAPPSVTWEHEDLPRESLKGR